MGITAGIALLPELGAGLTRPARQSFRVAMYGSGSRRSASATSCKAFFPNVSILSYFAATQAECVGLQLDHTSPALSGRAGAAPGGDRGRARPCRRRRRGGRAGRHPAARRRDAAAPAQARRSDDPPPRPNGPGPAHRAIRVRRAHRRRAAPQRQPVFGDAAPTRPCASGCARRPASTWTWSRTRSSSTTTVRTGPSPCWWRWTTPRARPAAVEHALGPSGTRRAVHPGAAELAVALQRPGGQRGGHRADRIPVPAGVRATAPHRRSSGPPSARRHWSGTGAEHVVARTPE